MAERETGTVKWFDSRKGYGFITRDRGGDAFVHYSSIGERRRLAEGERVEFTVAQEARGPRALDVTLAPAKKKDRAVAEERETGTIKWFNNARGYGFITHDAGGDVFVHYAAFRDVLVWLDKGTRVEFKVIHRPRGLCAVDVVLL